MIGLYNLIKFILNIYFSIFYKLKIINIENIPLDKNYILCSNHYSLKDPLLLISKIPSKIHWMAKKELFHNKILSRLFKKMGAFPVNRDSVEISTLRHSVRLLRNGEVLGIFPEGTRVKEFNIENAKAGLSLISINSNKPILPIYIESPLRIFRTNKVYVGDLINIKEEFPELVKNKEMKAISEEILKRIYCLPESSEI